MYIASHHKFASVYRRCTLFIIIIIIIIIILIIIIIINIINIFIIIK